MAKVRHEPCLVFADGDFYDRIIAGLRVLWHQRKEPKHASKQF